MKIKKVKLGYSLDDPDIFCSDCKEISGGSIELDHNNEYCIKAWCGCFVCTLADYNKNNLTTNYEVEE